MKTTKFWTIILLCAAIVLIFNASVSFAQRDDGKTTHIGTKIGVNASNMYANEVDDSNMRIGMHIGFFARFAISDNLAFQPEFIYTMKGAELEYRNTFVTGTATFALDYLEFPLLLVLNFTENLSIHGGMYLAALSKVKVTNESNVGLFNFEQQMNEDDFESLDYGLVIGAGVDFDDFSIGLRYDYGLKQVGKERFFGQTSYRFPDASNSALQFYIAINLL